MIGGMFILFLVLLLLNVPIAFSLGASSLFYLLTSNMNAAVLAQKFYAGIDSFTLLCICLLYTSDVYKRQVPRHLFYHL